MKHMQKIVTACGLTLALATHQAIAYDAIQVWGVGYNKVVSDCKSAEVPEEMQGKVNEKSLNEAFFKDKGKALEKTLKEINEHEVFKENAEELLESIKSIGTLKTYFKKGANKKMLKHYAKVTSTKVEVDFMIDYAKGKDFDALYEEGHYKKINISGKRRKAWDACEENAKNEQPECLSGDKSIVEKSAEDIRLLLGSGTSFSLSIKGEAGALRKDLADTLGDAQNRIEKANSSYWSDDKYADYRKKCSEPMLGFLNSFYSEAKGALEKVDD